MRSLLFVPGDSPKKHEKAINSAADALIFDLEDSVAESAKAAARETTLFTLQKQGREQRFFVRVNAFDTPHTLTDLAAIMPAAPAGIVLPKCSGPEDVNRLSYMLDAFEAANMQEGGKTRILAIVTETAQSLFTLGSYKGTSQRLWGMMWGAEDLSADLGAATNNEQGHLLEPYRLARTLCLAGAKAAGVVAVDAVSTNIKEHDSLKEEVKAAKRDGFTSKAIIHPNHIDIVNDGFTPDNNEINWAKSVVEAFDKTPNEGVLILDGKMIDKPHLKNAQRILASVRQQ